MSNTSQTDFAIEHYEYTLHRGLSPEPVFSTSASTIYHHPHFVLGNSDWTGVYQDITSMAIDYLAALALVNMEAGGANVAAASALQVARIGKDAALAVAGGANILNYHSTGRFDSGDVLDVIGIIPFEHATILGWISLGSNLSGLRIEVTP